MGVVQSKPCLIIGIGGISRSGKSTLTERLSKHYKCPSISIDNFLFTAVSEQFTTTTIHWESAMCCCFDDFYKEIFKLVTAGTAQMIILEGYLLYQRYDINNLYDLKIMLKMSKEGAYNRLLKMRPGLINSREWYDKIMWEEFILQNNLFSVNDPDSYEISGENDPDSVFKETVSIINTFIANKKINNKFKEIVSVPFITGSKGKICCICNKKDNLYEHSCGDNFHGECFNKLLNDFLDGAMETRKGILQCPKCNKKIDELFIQSIGNLNDYKKMICSDDYCYKCETCKRFHWSPKGHKIIEYICTICQNRNELH